MESKIRTTGGQPVETFHKGSGPNDGLMALLYAYMAYKFDITSGFTIRHGFSKEKERLRPIIARVGKRL